MSGSRKQHQKKRDIQLAQKQTTIIFLQEVQCTKATIDTWRSKWGYKALFRCFSSSSAGVCILFNNNFKCDILKTFSDSSGRYIVLIQNYDNGGLRMTDIASFNKALKSVWIRKYLDESNKGKWKGFFDAELEKLGGQTVFRGNLDIKDSK